MFKRDLSYLTGVGLVFAVLWMSISGLVQLRFELHRFIYHIYGAYAVILLTVVHIFANWRKFAGFWRRRFGSRQPGAKRRRKGDIEIILSSVLIFTLTFTLVSGFIQVKYNFPRARFVYHIYSFYCTVALAIIHICFNLKKVNIYLKRRSPAVFLGRDGRSWRPAFRAIVGLGTGILVIMIILKVIRMQIKWLLLNNITINTYPHNLES